MVRYEKSRPEAAERRGNVWEMQEKHAWTNKEWLDSGGAEIVLEVVRRIGWSVNVVDAENWELRDDIVSIGDRKRYQIIVNGAMPPWQQAIAAVATADSHFNMFAREDRDRMYPLFHANEMPEPLEVGEINEFIDRVRFSSAAAIAANRIEQGLPGGGGKDKR